MSFTPDGPQVTAQYQLQLCAPPEEGSETLRHSDIASSMIARWRARASFLVPQPDCTRDLIVQSMAQVGTAGIMPWWVRP